ncbi:MAG: 50S ribosomal protein L3 N(5)-glutamine methyltransferase [Burkholderiales bacterium]|nr:50S ribosomal protein L3 N(5)-glutamine methyltransferase [Burkholderiales bacterium]
MWQRATHELQAAGLHFGHGVTTAADEAAWLLIHALGWPLADSFAALDVLLQREVPADAHERFDTLLGERIATRKPVAYVLGEAWLQGERFLVDERVIVPRSLIAELLWDGLDPWLHTQPRHIADICTGSGCLAILAAKRWLGAQVLGSDISADALDVARANVALHALQDRVQLLQSDLLKDLPDNEPGLDLMLCNPPYVNAQSMRALPQEYRHEPELALAGGTDGMDLVRRLLSDASSRLAPQGMLVVEIGHERAHFEAAFPRLPVVWLSTSGGDDAVFLVEAAALRSPA